MESMISIPLTTSPKTVYPLSKNGVPPTVSYAFNCSSENVNLSTSLRTIFLISSYYHIEAIHPPILLANFNSVHVFSIRRVL